MKAKVRIFANHFSDDCYWDWEIVTEGRSPLYLCSYRDLGYAAKARAKRAAKRAAEKLGIEITEWEVE